MKAIMMSIRPEWVVKILNGEKTIEIRKRFPKDYVGWVYIYCTKNGHLTKCSNGIWYNSKHGKPYDSRFSYYSGYQGKVVARFWCDKVEEIKWHKDTAIDLDYYKVVNVIENEEILKASCLQLKELEDLQIKNAKYIPLDWGITFNLGKAIHITKLEPFDKPKEIKDFNAYCERGMKCLHCKHYWTDDSAGYSIPMCSKTLTRAPQSWCYIEV